ncbi:Sulfotransferase family cytosolic 1B member 1 [Holothuria leucospilota]|uniref:Sulfotransferase family cytosolic 1B member 1 n=1 Tax=Holothuria leucospilota TaxID=206669 RepID=A0A9Q1H8W0_HOLLE|nr:Sulfotransferase family cytosolic 1B member 1 [Holothuria leucospilota]
MATRCTEYTEEEHSAMLQRQMELFGISVGSHSAPKMYKFEGVTFNTSMPPEIIVGVRDWNTRQEDIFISTYPKSGTHWMYEIVLLILADGYSEKIDRSQMISHMIEMMYPPDLTRPIYEIFDEKGSPRVILSHLPWQFLPKQLTEQKKGKVIYVTRNPNDILASMSRFILASSGKEKDEIIWKYLINTFLTGDASYGSWFDHVERYWEQRNQGNVFFTSYEQLKKDFRSVVKPLSKFLGHELDEDALDRVEEKSSVKAMKKTYDDIERNIPGGAEMVKAMGKNSFIQKGVIGSWKDYFTVAENELFEEVCKEKMANWDKNLYFEWHNLLLR